MFRIQMMAIWVLRENSTIDQFNNRAQKLAIYWNIWKTSLLDPTYNITYIDRKLIQIRNMAHKSDLTFAENKCWNICGISNHCITYIEIIIRIQTKQFTNILIQTSTV